MSEPYAVTAEEWRDRWEEAARHALRHKHDAEMRGERIDRLRHAVADLRAERDALAAALAAVVALPEAETVAPNLWVSGYNTAIRNVRAAARVEHPEPAAICPACKREFGVADGDCDWCDPTEEQIEAILARKSDGVTEVTIVGPCHDGHDLGRDKPHCACGMFWRTGTQTSAGSAATEEDTADG